MFKAEKFNRLIKSYKRRKRQPKFCLLLILYFVVLAKVTYVRSEKVVKNVVNINDKIITLSTCARDNMRWKVVHVKLVLISESSWFKVFLVIILLIYFV